VLVRVHALRVRDCDHTHRARTYRDLGPRESLRYSTDLEAHQQGRCSTPPCTRREGRTSWLDVVSRDHPSSNLMPQACRAGCSLNRPGRTRGKEAGSGLGQLRRPGRRHVTAGPTQSATLHSARRPTTHRARPLDCLLGWTRILWRAASPSGGPGPPLAHCPGSHGSNSEREPQRTQHPNAATRTTLKFPSLELDETRVELGQEV
jgi:hypothetical protein